MALLRVCRCCCAVFFSSQLALLAIRREHMLIIGNIIIIYSRSDWSWERYSMIVRVGRPYDDEYPSVTKETYPSYQQRENQVQIVYETRPRYQYGQTEPPLVWLRSFPRTQQEVK